MQLSSQCSSEAKHFMAVASGSHPVPTSYARGSTTTHVSVPFSSAGLSTIPNNRTSMNMVGSGTSATTGKHLHEQTRGTRAHTKCSKHSACRLVPQSNSPAGVYCCTVLAGLAESLSCALSAPSTSAPKRTVAKSFTHSSRPALPARLRKLGSIGIDIIHWVNSSCVHAASILVASVGKCFSTKAAAALSNASLKAS